MLLILHIWTSVTLIFLASITTFHNVFIVDSAAAAILKLMKQFDQTDEITSSLIQNICRVKYEDACL